MINFLEETFVFDIKLTLQKFNVLWPKTCQIFVSKLSACLLKSISTCLEEVFEDELFCIFLFYKSVQFLASFLLFLSKKSGYFCQKCIPRLLMKKCFGENCFHLFIFGFLTEFFRQICHEGILLYCMKSLWKIFFHKAF